ncbi:hypothetical protein PQZ46_00305 [bacterium]|jgi:hypothetical protein|nr:hypothetical protein [bacterium]
MKIKIGGYPNRLMCNIHARHMNKKYEGLSYENQTHEDYVLEAIDDAVQSVYNVFNWIWFDRRTQKTKVHIDKWDTWSMDHTLAHIVLPMLVQLKRTKHGAPWVAVADVPKELRPTKKDINAYNKDGSTDDKFFKRWDYVLDEMIWAFEQKCRDHWEEDYYGPYIESKDKRELFGRFEWIDDEGRQKHQERMTNGFKLFGKYYENLWD